MGNFTDVAVTGADGFIGSHLVQALAKEAAHVRALTFYTGRGDHGWLDQLHLPENVRRLPLDIRDPERVKACLENCDLVFHLAALIAIPWSYVAPRHVMAVNLDGTLNVLEAVRSSQTRVVIVSSSEVYGTAQTLPIDETHPLSAQSPYAASKIAADQLALSYHRSYGSNLVIARPFNTYGPRQSLRAVIPTLCMQLKQQANPIQIGALTPRRDFVYVADTVQALMALARCDEATGDVVQIATNHDISIAELAQKLAKIAGVSQLNFTQDAQRLRPERSEVMHLRGAYAKLETFTGWKPQTSLDEGLAATYHAYRAATEVQNHFHL